jgi:hypothetical protein
MRHMGGSQHAVGMQQVEGPIPFDRRAPTCQRSQFGERCAYRSGLCCLCQVISDQSQVHVVSQARDGITMTEMKEAEVSI